ncbi:hypothetical protein D3C77_69890 [compost metagenome]
MNSSAPFQIRDSYIRVDTMADTYARMAEQALALLLVFDHLLSYATAVMEKR